MGEPTSAKPSGLAAVKWMPWAAVIFGLWTVSAILSSRCLYADGSHEFVRVLEAQDFVALMWSRHFAFYVYQFPLVLAIKLGIMDLHWLRVAFGLGCFLPWPLALFCCWRISKKYFWLAAAGCAAGYLNAAFMAVGEHILAHALFWPALFVLLFSALDLFAAAVLLAAATGLVFCYESQIFLCVPLAGLALWRAWGERSAHRPLAGTVFLTAAALFLGSICVGLGGVFLPEAPANLYGFKHGAIAILQHTGWTLDCTLVWAGLVLAACGPEKIAQFIIRPAVTYLLLALFLVWGAWPLLAPGRLDNAVQFDNRYLDLLVPLALLPVALIARSRPRWLESRQTLLVQLIAALWIAQSLWQISATVNWYHDVMWMRETLATRQGVIPVRVTVLAADRMQGGDVLPHSNSGRFEWSWPCLSISLATTTNINCLICSELYLDPVRRATVWEPFDPLNPEKLPRLEHYGIRFDGYTNALPFDPGNVYTFKFQPGNKNKSQ